MKSILLTLILGVVMLTPMVAQAKYHPKKPEPWAKMTLSEKHIYMHKLKGNSWGIVKHGNDPVSREWHRKAMKRIMRQMRIIHRRMGAIKKHRQLRRLMSSINLGSLNCISCWDRVASCESGGRWDYNGS
jgi:hypothetical protein